MNCLRIVLIALLIVPFSSLADKPDNGHKDLDKKEWFRKLKETKHNFMVKKLDLTKAQQDEFFRLYDAKEQARFEAESKVRSLEKEITKKGDAATDEDYSRAITAQYQLNHDLAKIESQYEEEFRKVLTKRQLYKLRNAEFSFQRKLMQQHNRAPKYKK